MRARTVSTKYFDVAARDVPRDLFPSGRVKISLGRVKENEAEKRRLELNKLRTWGAWNVLRAIADGSIHVTDVVRRVKENGEAALNEFRREIEAHKLGETPTVGEQIEEYLKWYGTHRRARSLRQVKSRLKRFGEQQREDGTLMRELKFDQLMKSDIERAIAAISSVSTTQEAIRLAVSGLYTWAVEDESEKSRTEKRAARWSTNPSQKVERRERHVRVVTAAESEMLKLLAAAEIYQEAYLRSYAQFGLRRNELIHTRMHDDLDVRDWIWRIQARGPDERCGCPDCQADGWKPKSKRSRRTLLVPEGHPLRVAITRYLQVHPCEPGDFVFRNPRTARIWDEGRIEHDFKSLCERAEVRYGLEGNGLTLHALRHTCATELLRAGVRESVIAALLGDTVETIVRTYVHLRPDDLAEGVARGPRYHV